MRARKSGSFFTCLALAVGLVVGASAQTQNPPNQRNTPPAQVKKIEPVNPQRIQGTGVRITYAGWRTGYSPYPGLTIRRVFSFNRYLIDYEDDIPVVFSPFYLYPNLPPFISVPVDSSVAQAPDAPAPTQAPLQTDTTTTDTPSATPSTVNDADPDLAVTDLKHAWEFQDPKIISKLCPTAGKVKVSVLDQDYSLDAQDFEDLIHDGAVGTRTTHWTVVDEHADGDQISLTAKHQFFDADGKSRAVIQTYLLVKEASGFVIREFGSEPYQDQNLG